MILELHSILSNQINCSLRGGGGGCGFDSDLALGTICVMCLTIIRPMVMDVENVVLLLGFFFRHDYIVH